jgi:hypothetical protein
MRLHAYEQADEPVDDATFLKVSAKAGGALYTIRKVEMFLPVEHEQKHECQESDGRGILLHIFSYIY